MRMFAYTTKQGTAMGETALCGDCCTFPNMLHSWTLAKMSPDWNEVNEMSDCTSNDALVCRMCGKGEQVDEPTKIVVNQQMRDMMKAIKILDDVGALLKSATPVEVMLAMARKLREYADVVEGGYETETPVSPADIQSMRFQSSTLVRAANDCLREMGMEQVQL